ncbi:MAG TPA: tryptophan-rich sensory protein [Candidatus Barnesiella excrementavium]|nr:tryptophan-rich sensory protein [Candidatus Barnesiella excrementavium]
MKGIVYYLLPILLCLGVGFAGSLFQAQSMIEWYPLLDKSTLTPPGIAFPIAWSVIYICMGISLGRLIHHSRDRVLFWIWGIQLVLNFLWSLFFFTLRYPLLGLVDILLLDVLVFIYTTSAYRRDKAAAWLFVPYFLWLLFATYLNGYIYLYN